MLKILLFLGLGLAAGVPLDFTSADEFILHVDTQPYVVALMYTQHCPHCVVLERQFIQADKEWSSARGMPSTIVMANLDQATDLIDPYQLEFVPTVLVFTNGTYQHVPDDLFSSIVTLANAYYDTEVVDVDAQSFNDNIDIWMEDFDRIIAIPPTLNSLVLSEARNSHAGLYKFIRVHGNGIDMKNIGASLDITEGSSLLIDSRVREEPPILRVEDPDRSFLQWTLLNSLPEADFLTDAIFNQCLFANVPLVVLFLDDPQLLTHTFDASAFVEDMTNLAWDLRVRGIDIHFSVFGNSFELGSYEEEEDIARVAGAFGVQPSQLPAVAVYDFDQGISYPIVDLSDNAIEYVEEKLFAFLNGDVESLNPFKYATEVSEAHHPESNLVLHINGKDFYELVVEGETSSLIFYYDSFCETDECIEAHKTVDEIARSLNARGDDIRVLKVEFVENAVPRRYIVDFAVSGDDFFLQLVMGNPPARRIHSLLPQHTTPDVPSVLEFVTEMTALYPTTSSSAIE